jgi:homoserine dehydrogenase
MSPTELLEKIETFLAATGMKPSTFGDKAVNDPAFVFGLRNGREPRFSTVEKVLKFMAEQKEAA